MEYIDLKFIINNTISIVLASFIVGPFLIWLYKKMLNWQGWRRVWVVCLPFLIVLAFFFLLIFLGRIRHMGHPLYAFSCLEDCREKESDAAQSCAELSLLYANPKRRSEIFIRRDLREALPENPPQPKRGLGNNELPFQQLELAAKTFDACMEKKGYTIQNCEEQKVCYRVYLNESPLGYPVDYRKKQLVEMIPSKEN